MESNEKKATAIAKKVAKNKKDLIFAGAATLMVKPNSQKEIVERKMIVLVAKALKINPMSVVIFANLPYVDNKGRKEKMASYCAGAQFRYEWVHIAADDVEKAICKAKIIDGKGKDLCDWVIGECSPATMKMGTLKGYQNHMAQTRAENRAFEAAFGTKFRSELYSGIERELNTGKVDAEVAQKALNAGNTSAEEAVQLNRQPIAQDPFKMAIKAIEQCDTLAALTMMKGRISRGTKMPVGQRQELILMVEKKIVDINKQ